MNKLTTMAVLTLAFTTSVARCEEPTKATKPEPAKLSFCVKAGNCSRSIRAIGTHEYVSAACWAACLAKEKNQLVEITVGNDGYTLHQEPTEYRVYHRACKTYALVLTTNDAKAVTAKQKELAKEDGDIQIVKVYTQKAKN